MVYKPFKERYSHNDKEYYQDFPLENNSFKDSSLQNDQIDDTNKAKPNNCPFFKH